MTVISGAPCNSDRDWSIYFDILLMSFCWSTRALFVDFVPLFSFHYEIRAKAKCLFYAKENVRIRMVKGEVSLISQPSLDDVSCSKFQYLNILTQTIFEMSQFKMPCGTCDPLWLISRLNTENVWFSHVNGKDAKLTGGWWCCMWYIV